jgi:hypothetical protein
MYQILHARPCLSHITVVVRLAVNSQSGLVLLVECTELSRLDFRMSDWQALKTSCVFQDEPAATVLRLDIIIMAKLSRSIS